jgi:hypothetical protein
MKIKAITDGEIQMRGWNNEAGDLIEHGEENRGLGVANREVSLAAQSCRREAQQQCRSQN